MQSLFQLSNTLVIKKLRRGPEVCCTWNLYGWPRVCVTRDGLNIGLLHIGHADSVKSMCYFEELNNISSFPSVL